MTKCDYYNCEQWRGVKRFYSYEEGYVYLCNKHIKLNLKRKTGYVG